MVPTLSSSHDIAGIEVLKMQRWAHAVGRAEGSEQSATKAVGRGMRDGSWESEPEGGMSTAVFTYKKHTETLYLGVLLSPAGETPRVVIGSE